ncbi:MAG: DUF2283 domain-containing protein [Roseiflexaceae bacterium]|nr:DUF2283 domain-containing protein [Roseiflexus sp.]MDW8233829.1 DUF2283 domain-containing protein [Roseiflexaceae bacterium]
MTVERNQRPQQATETEMTDDGILVRYRGRELVGITILDASKRYGSCGAN